MTIIDKIKDLRKQYPDNTALFDLKTGNKITFTQIDTDMKTGWAHKTIDGSLSCQYEHQFVITKDGPVILTSQGEEGTY